MSNKEKVISVMLDLSEVTDQYIEYVKGMIPKDIADLSEIDTLVFKTEYPWRMGFLTAISQFKTVIENIEEKEIPKFVLQTILNQFQDYVGNQNKDVSKERFHEAWTDCKTDAH